MTSQDRLVFMLLCPSSLPCLVFQYIISGDSRYDMGADWILKSWIKFQIAVKTFQFGKVLNSQIVSLV
jgi:hypothetical protein